MKKQRRSKIKKCPQTRKTMFNQQSQAKFAMMRTISHDPHADMFDLHVYPCPHKIEGKEHFHVGHKRWYKEPVKVADTVSVSVG